MQTLIIELDSSNKAKELSSLLSSLDFVKKVSSISKPKALIAALQEHENLKISIVKRKNKAIARYL
jgi:APAF-1 helical domain